MAAPVHQWRRTIESAPIDPTAKLVALVVSLRLNGEGEGDMRREVIARGCGLSVNTIRRALGRLQRCGLLGVDQGSHHSPNHYRALIPGASLASPLRGITDEPPKSRQGARANDCRGITGEPLVLREDQEEQRAPAPAPARAPAREGDGTAEGQERGEGEGDEGRPWWEDPPPPPPSTAWERQAERDARHTSINAGDPEPERDAFESSPAYREALQRQRDREAQFGAGSEGIGGWASEDGPARAREAIRHFKNLGLGPWPNAEPEKDTQP